MKDRLFSQFSYFTFLTLFVYDFSFTLKSSSVMLCHDLNEQNEVGDDEDEEYEKKNEVSEYVGDEFRHL